MGPGNYEIQTARNFGKYANRPDTAAGETPTVWGGWPKKEDCQLWGQDWVRGWTSITLPKKT